MTSQPFRGVLVPVLTPFKPNGEPDAGPAPGTPEGVAALTPEDLRALFEAARWTASSSNEQPWRYLVGRRGTETHRKIFQSLVEWNQAWAGSASVLLLGAAKKTFTKDGSAN